MVLCYDDVVRGHVNTVVAVRDGRLDAEPRKETFRNHPASSSAEYGIEAYISASINGWIG